MVQVQALPRRRKRQKVVSNGALTPLVGGPAPSAPVDSGPPAGDLRAHPGAPNFSTGRESLKRPHRNGFVKLAENSELFLNLVLTGVRSSIYIRNTNGDAACSCGAPDLLSLELQGS